MPGAQGDPMAELARDWSNTSGTEGLNNPSARSASGDIL
jgi:hypothetical protein